MVLAFFAAVGMFRTELSIALRAGLNVIEAHGVSTVIARDDVLLTIVGFAVRAFVSVGITNNLSPVSTNTHVGLTV